MSSSPPASTKSLYHALFNRRMLACVLTGFASGLPLYTLIQFVPAWLREHGVDLSVIGLFALATFPYTWKFLWSPLMDRVVPPFLGRRRGWMIITQAGLTALFVVMGFLNPRDDIGMIAALVSVIAFFSASQDIVIDAYRREILPEDELGPGNAYFTQAYRLATFIPGSLALILTGVFPWSVSHWVIAGFMALCMGFTLFIREGVPSSFAPKTIVEAVVEPFKEFFSRQSISAALYVLLFIFLYKIGDNMATALETAFFLDMGFTAPEIGSVAKVAKTVAAALGTVVGGVMMVKLGINKSLWVFGVFQMISILGYVWLSVAGRDFFVLVCAAGMEYFGVGLGTVALLAFMARATNAHFSATQFALFSSLAALPRTVVNASTGYLIEGMGYTHFFIFCFCCAIPGMMLLLKVAPWKTSELEGCESPSGTKAPSDSVEG